MMILGVANDSPSQRLLEYVIGEVNTRTADPELVRKSITSNDIIHMQTFQYVWYILASGDTVADREKYVAERLVDARSDILRDVGDCDQRLEVLDACIKIMNTNWQRGGRA